MASKVGGETDQPVSVEVEESEIQTHDGTDEVDSKDSSPRAGAVGGGVEGGALPSVARQPVIVTNGLKLKIERKVIHHLSYALFPTLGQSTPVDWTLLELEDIEGEHIRCHELLGNELLEDLFQRYKQADSKAVVLINTEDSHILPPDLVSGVGKPSLPVLVLTKSDGQQILQCLEDTGEIEENVYAKIEAETDVDGGMGGVAEEKSQQKFTSPHGTPKKQQVHQSPPDSSITWWQKQKNKMGLLSKAASDLKAEIKRLMYSSDKTPVPVVEDQGRFIMVMAAFHQYERNAKREGNHSDMNEVIKKLQTHMDALFSVDLPFYIFVVYRMHKKYTLYSCDEMRTLISDVINKVESEDKQELAHALNAFCERGDFRIMFNPDKSEDKQILTFHQLELACLELAEVSYRLQITSVANAGELPNGFKPVYKGFVYSRMLWISMAMKLHEKRGAQPTRKTTEVWMTKLVKHHHRVILSSGFIKELEAGLEVGQLLQLSTAFTFQEQNLIDFMAVSGDRLLRPLAQIMECFKMLRRFVITLDKAMVMASNLRAVYSDYLVRPVLPYKMKSVSCEGTLNGCITEGIELLDVMFEWLMELTKDKDMKVIVDQELKGWLLFLLSLVDITGDNPAQHLRYFIKGKERVVKQYKQEAQEYVVSMTRENFGQLSIQQFHSLYKSFKVFPNPFVHNFLKSYSISEAITLSDPTWREFFSAVVVRSQSARKHFYLADFMIACSLKYKASGRAVAFITDLLKLEVEKLLSVDSKETRECNEVRINFSSFLKDFINRNALIHGILDHMAGILKSMSNKQNDFQKLVLDVLRREVVPDLRNIQTKKSNNFRNLMREIVRILKNDLTWLSTLSTKQNFCWGVLGTCVSKIAVNKDSFDWVHHYSDIISGFELGVVYSSFCTDKKLSQDQRIIIDGLPEVVKTHHSEDLRRYFEWIGEIQGVLQHWKKKFQLQEVTYDGVVNYASSHVRFLPLGESMGSPHLVVESALTERVKTGFLQAFEMLNVYLLKYVKGQPEAKCCKLPSLLEIYGVALPQVAQEFIVKKVAFPGEGLIPKDQLGINPLHSSTSGLFQPGYDISLRLHKTVTLRELGKVLGKLDVFLQPLLDQLDMLVFFKLHKSCLFDKYLKYYLKKIAEELQEPQELTSQMVFKNFPFSIPFATSPGSFVPSSFSKEDDKAQMKARDNLVRALSNTQQLVRRIMLGKATYSEIVAEDETMLKGLDLEREFAVLHNYGQHTNLAEATYSGLEGVRSMLELFQYTTHIKNIRNVCHQYSTLKGCKDDPKLEELCDITKDHIRSEDRSKMTPMKAKEKMSQVKQILCLKEGTSSKCMDIFAAMADSANFYQFVRDKQFHGQQGQAIFRQQYELITAQLQHEEYDESVLNHLLVAFKIITPFMDSSKNLTSLMQEITSLNATHGFKQLNTVNSNITLIRLWFSRAEGDTLENVAKELECIMDTGSYTFHLGVDSGVELGEDLGGGVKGQLYLEFEPFSTSSKSIGGSHNGLSGSMKGPRRERKSREQINDFLRKLGFMDKEKEGGDLIKQFLHLSQTAYKLLNVYQKLKDLGHPQYLTSDGVASIPCSTAKTEVDAKVQSTQQLLGAWTQEVGQLQSRYHWLLYLNMPKLLKLYWLLCQNDEGEGNSRVDAILHEVSFLSQNDSIEREKLRAGVESTLKTSVPAASTDSPMLIVGQFLHHLFRNHSLPRLSPRSVRETISIARRSATKMTSHQPLFFCPAYSHASRLCLMLEVFSGIPEPYQVLRCQATTSEEELELFVKRAQTEINHYLVLDVNQLPFKLQEQLVQLHLNMQNEEQQLLDMSLQPLTTSTITFVETSPSMLREMPWISLKEGKEPRINLEEAKKMCRPAASHLACAQLVYGAAGDGKTHYIKKQLSCCPSHKTIAINEAFTPIKAISKLRSLPLYQKHVGIFFNFTILPPGDSVAEVERERYRELMDVIAWFFFDLLVLGYAEDPETGLSFRIPGGLEWAIYIEVPSRHTDVTAGEALKLLHKEVPALYLIGSPQYIHPDTPFTIDGDVQLVCKYLQAYNLKDSKQRGIDRLYKEGHAPIKFSTDPDLLEESCHKLLHQHMPKHIASCKITQQLFIRYMTRRCNFLDTLPAFNYNIGRGELVTKDYGMPVYTDTSHLGSTLLSTMLKEVSDFCDPTIKENWSKKAHQQLIYDFKDGGSSLGLISLHPDLLKEADTAKFKKIGVNVPSMTEVYSRDVLDSFLSRALNVELENKRLGIVDDSAYVLTLDYTIKMLNIHERHECGIPVIIEGETGVGKTALVEMLSKLWNQSLLLEWTKQKGRLTDFIHKKLGDCPGDMIPENYQACLQAVEAISTNEATEDALILLCSYVDGSRGMLYSQVLKFLSPMRNDPVLPLLTFKDSDYDSLDNLFEAVDQEASPEMTAHLLHAILKAQVKSSFHKINVHAAMTPTDIKELFAPVLEQAELLQNTYRLVVERVSSAISVVSSPHRRESMGSVTMRGGFIAVGGSPEASLDTSATAVLQSRTPFVTVFLDEVNTSSCLGLFKEIIVDRAIDGEIIPSNVFIVAACNPHRGNSLASHKSAWLRGTYYVRSLHPTLKLLMWDYGSLDEHQERDYINAKMKMINKDMENPEIASLADLIVTSQKMMRDFAFEQLKEGLKTKSAQSLEVAHVSSRSCVSQRDIQRVFTFYQWFKSMYSKDDNHRDRQDNHRRAMLVSLGVVYYMRLNAQFRKKYSNFLNEINRLPNEVSFSKAFMEELDYFVHQVELPKGIARTLALKENIFATIVCAVTHTPLIIVGAPGSSKTLSFNQTIANLKGQESKHAFFRNTDIFRSLDPHYYQCSRRTTSNEIQTVFSRAINRQRSHQRFNLPIYCVVFMDEAGLPEESHESLKVLHYHLDKQEVSFVAITNHVLDAAKTNRAISLFRPEASDDDLETLAKGCLCSNPDEPPPEMEHDLKTVVKFCQPYTECMRNSQFSKFFGLRDFIQFINYLRRKKDEGQAILSPQLVMQALERNFNGSEEFESVCKKFLQAIGSHLEDVTQRGILEVLQDSMQDRPQASQDLTENEVRYKLIIDPSEDDSLVRSLFSMGLLKRENTRMFVCSDFPGDGQLQKINTIGAIRHSAIEGHTVVMSQTDDIHESFYDLFNQRFRRIDDPEHGPRYYTNIAIGAHLKPSRVHPNFQCVVVVKKSEVENTPAPFLNRFEKYLISHGSLLEMVLHKLPPCMGIMMRAAKDKVADFISSVYGNTSLYGLQLETLDSLILDFIPPLDHTYFKLGDDSLVDTSQSPELYLLQELLGALRNNAGFHIPKLPMTELEADADHLFQLIQRDPKYEGLLHTLTHDDAMHAVADALNLLYKAPGPQEDGGQLDLTPEGCMVVSLLQQLLVRLLMKRVLQLMTTEAVILYRNKIPYSYLNHYLTFQAHFSLKDLVSAYHGTYSATKLDSARSPNKLVVYSRSSPLVHSLPAQFLCNSPRNGHVDSVGVASARDLVFEETDKLMVHKLSSLLSQTSVQELLTNFVYSDKAEVLLLAANMQDTSIKTVNHIRVMIEEAELQGLQRQNQPPKLFVLLLHFPPALFFKHCYPALFLKGWDHTYLDTVTHSSPGGVVDIQDWFKRCCFPATSSEDDGGSSECDPLFTAAKHLLPQSIPVLSAQMYFGSKRDGSFNSSMNATQRGKALERLLNDYEVGDVLCQKFCNYWKPKVMLEYLERAATFSKQRESTLNITDSIQTQFKTLFMDFCVYMLTRANENYNLDVIYAEEKSSPVKSLFLAIFKQFPIPRLSQLGVLSTSLLAPKPEVFQSRFPFFSFVCDLMEKLVESCTELTNQKLNVLVERDNQGLLSIGGSALAPSNNPGKKLELLSSEVLDRLELLVNSSTTNALGLMLNSMFVNPDLWKKYFNDFVSYKLNLPPQTDTKGGPRDDIAQRLLRTCFGQLHELAAPKRLAQLHSYIRVYQLHLAQMCSLLRPLSKIKKLQSGPNLLSPSSSDSVNTSFAVMNSVIAEEHLVQAASQGWVLANPTHLINFVVTTLFEALVSSVYSSSPRKELLTVWFETYRNLIVLPSMKCYLYLYLGMPEMREVEVRFHLMHATFITLTSCPVLNQDSLVKGCQTFQTLFGRYFQENATLRPDKRCAHLEEVVEVVLEVLSPNQSSQMSLQQCSRPIQAAMEALLLHYFSPYQTSHHLEDMMWFLTWANQQQQWCADQHQDTDSVYEQSIGVVAGNLEEDLLEKSVVQEALRAEVPCGAMELNRFKYHLSCILGRYKDMGDPSGDGDQLHSGPLFMYRQDVRTLVGRVLCPLTNETGLPGPYVPVFYQKSPPILAGKHAENKLMQQPLCHLYFLTVLEHLLAKQNTDSFQQRSHMAGLVRLAASTHASLKTAVGGEAVLLWVELQAVTQVLLQQLAQHLDPNQKQKLVEVHQIQDDLNRLLDDKELDCALSHGMVLSLHLFKLLKSSRRFADFLTSKHDSLRIVRCLQPIQAEFITTAELKPHLFPFLQPGAEVKLTVLYNEVSKTMNGIHSGEVEVGQLVTIAENCFGAVSDEGVDVRLSFRMVLWLVTYYEFYDKKVESSLLCNLMGGQELAEYLHEDGYIRLLQCFLNPALMVEHKEAPNALTDQQVLQLGSDGRAKVLHREGQQVDPIYQFFRPGQEEKLDQSDIDLRHALANLVGVVIGSPSCSNHLWYHLFEADKLEKSYMTGFMYNSKIKRDGLQYDCGVELSPEGQFGRQDYKQHACRGTYTLHSLYLLLWSNFGAFCMSLLTQPDADARIHGIIISEWLSLRHYCLSQLKTVWMHMRNNMGLSEEQRAFFVTQALYKLRQLLVSPRIIPSAMKEGAIVPDTLRGVFETHAQLDAYEKAWHEYVYQPTWDQQSEKFAELCNQQQNLFFTGLRRLEVHYPHFPTEQEFTHSILSAGNLQEHSEGGRLCLLARFAMEWQRLQLGGMLLPDLVELYQWLHANLSHLITYDRAANLTIGQVIKLATENSSKEYGKHLYDLYKRVELHYNTYVELIGGAIGAGACALVRQGNKIFTMADDMPILHFLSDLEEEGQGNDWLYVVMADIIAGHNQTIENLYSHPLARLLPDEPPKVHPAEVSSNTAIVGHLTEQHGVNSFLQLLRSRYQPSQPRARSLPGGSSLVSLACRSSAVSPSLQDRQQVPMFVMEQLEEDLVSMFIAGKPLISSENLLRTVFKFKEEVKTVAGTSQDVACTALDIHHMGERLPEEFKFPLSEPLQKRFEYEFHSASYHLLNEVVMALRTVIGHLTKALEEVRHTSHEELKEMPLPHFMLNLYEHLKSHNEVLREIGILSAQPSHLQCLSELPLMSTFDCLKLFFGWVEDGYYDFGALPFPFKVHMIYQDRLLMEQQLRLRWLGSVSDLKEELQSLTDVLKHSEFNITSRLKEAASKPILDYLLEIQMLDDDEDQICRYLSRTILLQHYVAFRVALRKLSLRVQQELQGKEDGEDANGVWLEFESELWTTHLPHLREEIHGDGMFVFDPRSQRYGFQEDEEEGEDSGGFTAALLQEAMEDQEGSFKIQEPADEEQTENQVIGHTLDLNEPSDDEKSDRDDEVRPDESVRDSRGGGATGEADQSADDDLVARLKNDPKLKQHLLSIVQKDVSSLEETARRLTPQDVADFLSRINLSQYSDTFKESDISGELLLEADVDILKELGVESPLHQMLIMELFRRELKGGAVKYSVDYMMDFLSQYKLEKYGSTLSSHGIDGDMLLDVDDKLMKSVLKEVGVTSLVDALKIKSKFKTFVSET